MICKPPSAAPSSSPPATAPTAAPATAASALDDGSAGDDTHTPHGSRRGCCRRLARGPTGRPPGPDAGGLPPAAAAGTPPAVAAEPPPAAAAAESQPAAAGAAPPAPAAGSRPFSLCRVSNRKAKVDDGLFFMTFLFAQMLLSKKRAFALYVFVYRISFTFYVESF
eukprot:CAMPEP_0178993052 /NCGR_PEP_ID=MMETSP0795-20121207/6476_1 /TAXON_ID=88552 /ORGANISM="Amoebophrya sp., Strain Ameob2" /LENGTH=165 /DNA_ID=CAMNT_0020685043 /DNA_START=1385 /DNA_END=1883 /DNA_ORIENTATION=+